jgi:hypothetical protein
MTETITGKTVDASIENPEQASTNFYWLYTTKDQTFNLQTTIRGVLDFEQIKAHVNSALGAIAFINEIGGQAKDLRNKYDTTPAATLPQPTAVETIIAEVQKADPIFNQGAHDITQNVVESFDTEKLAVTISNGKKYFKVKGGMWSKYGVTVWDEVLVAAGIPVGKLEAQEYNLVGYKATFTRKADGKPEKVTQLEKVA